MITIPFEVIESRVLANEKLSKGVDLIKELTSQLIIPNGIVPVICGGAVRDVLVKGTDPNDIDIFFVRGEGDITSRREEVFSLLRDNLYLWLEDNEIEWNSLLRQSNYEEFSPAQYSDIVNFEKDGVQFQLMVPTTSKALDTLCDGFPAMCRLALSTTGFHFSAIGLAAANYDLPVMLNSRDARYCAKKYPGQNVYTFVSGNECLMNFICQITASGILRTHQIPTLDPSSFLSEVEREWPRANALSDRFREWVRSEYNYVSGNLDNTAVIRQLGGNHSQGRSSTAEPAAPMAVTQNNFQAPTISGGWTF